MPFIVAGVLPPVSGDASSWGVVGEPAALAGTSLICCVSIGSTGGKVAPIDSRCSAAAFSAFFRLWRRISQVIMKGDKAKRAAFTVMPIIPPVGSCFFGGWTRV